MHVNADAILNAKLLQLFSDFNFRLTITGDADWFSMFACQVVSEERTSVCEGVFHVAVVEARDEW